MTPIDSWSRYECKKAMPKKQDGGQHKELKVRLSKELLTSINDYRHRQKLDTRTDAVVELLTRALQTEAAKTNGAPDGQDPQVHPAPGEGAC